MSKYRLFLDRRTWSNASFVVEADSLDDAMNAYHQGLLDERVRRLAWDDDDVEMSVVDVEKE